MAKTSAMDVLPWVGGAVLAYLLLQPKAPAPSSAGGPQVNTGVIPVGYTQSKPAKKEGMSTAWLKTAIETAKAASDAFAKKKDNQQKKLYVKSKSCKKNWAWSETENKCVPKAWA